MAWSAYKWNGLAAIVEFLGSPNPLSSPYEIFQLADNCLSQHAAVGLMALLLAIHFMNF